MKAPLCEKCIYWTQLNHIGLGQCRKYAPGCHRVVPESKHGTEWLVTEWPLTQPDDWCGEYKGAGFRDSYQPPGMPGPAPAESETLKRIK